jgi:1,5-anhydro-D-fructose reductase (1,5-anhydro-D-mannitol-forming)
MAGIYAACLLEDTRDLRLVGIAGGSRAPGLAAQHGVEAVSSVEALLARPDVDAVVIATPHSLHLPQALAAAAAGKHVFLEKPMALNVAECREMIEACRAAGVLLTVGQITRRLEAPRVARQLIDEGGIGSVRMIQVWRTLAGGLPFPAGAWPLDPNEGGPFLDWGSHGCDIVRWYAGAEAATAFGHSTRYDPTAQVEPSAMVQFTFANDVMAHIWMSYEVPHAVLGGRARYLVVGSEAMLEIHAYGQVSRSRDDGWETVYQSDDWESPDAAWGYPNRYIREGFARQVQEFGDAIAGGASLTVTGEDGLRAVEMVEAVMRSASSGQSVSLPLASRS